MPGYKAHLFTVDPHMSMDFDFAGTASEVKVFSAAEMEVRMVRISDTSVSTHVHKNQDHYVTTLIVGGDVAIRFINDRKDEKDGYFGAEQI